VDLENSPGSNAMKTLIHRLKLICPLVALSVGSLLVLYFVVSDLLNQRLQINELSGMQSINEYGIKAGILVHDLQKERGLSAVYVESQERVTNQKLLEQRQQTDNTLSLFLAHINSPRLYDDIILPQVLRTTEVESAIVLLREKVDSRQLSTEQIIVQYNLLDKKLLDVLSQGGMTGKSSGSYRQTIAYYYLLNSIENAGMARALLTSAFAAKTLNPQRNRTLQGFLAAQNTYLELFEITASIENREALAALRSKEPFKVVQLVHKVLLQNENISMVDKPYGLATLNVLSQFDNKPIDANVWWLLASARIDLLHDLALELSRNLIDNSALLLGQKQQTYWLKLLLYMSVGLLIYSLIFLWLSARRQADKIMLESQVRQSRSQKMEALGNLTGGIAHDYNNMLGVILGYAHLLEENLKHLPELSSYANQIQRAGKRGAKLTADLLSFSKKQPAKQKMCDLNQLVKVGNDMLYKILTPRIELKLNLFSGLWPVKIDLGAFEDALLNMSINAMHAMPSGGTLTISTSNIKLLEPAAESVNLVAGDYVSFAMEDTGCGMSAELVANIFDPYFTTKGKEGSGLGLSQVYGFTKSSGGEIDVFSVPGFGSRFTLYFPHEVSAIMPIKKPFASSAEDFRGIETILVVDDEKSLCDLAEVLLVKQGYQVMCAQSGAEAMTLLERRSVDLMVSDIIMPKMNGYQLAKKVQQQHPDVLIQLVSGFRGDQNTEGADMTLMAPVINKPYSAEHLLGGIRQQLDRRKQGTVTN
jgi:signal transduction histidine kinase